MLDLHNDVLTKLTHMPGYDFSRAHAPATFYNPLRLDLDLPRIRRGGIDALGCLMFAGFRFDVAPPLLAPARLRAQAGERHADAIALARTADDIRAARARGQAGAVPGRRGQLRD